MIRGVLPGCVAVLALAASASGEPGKQAVPLVSYSELGKEVRALKGKVVVVYFWASY
jgi:hypothetical protein